MRTQLFLSGVVSVVLLVQTTTARAVNISSTWFLPQEGFPVFYRYFRDRITWAEADAVCQFHHSSLVTVDTSVQYDATRAYLKELDIINNVWIGLKKNSAEEAFKWIDFKEMAVDGGYWQEQIPKSASPLCVATDPAADFRWHTLNCGGPESASFICEMPVPVWAQEADGCMLTSLPSLSVIYLPEQGAVELTSDCGLDGTRRIACKGQANHEEMIKQLSCDHAGSQEEELGSASPDVTSTSAGTTGTWTTSERTGTTSDRSGTTSDRVGTTSERSGTTSDHTGTTSDRTTSDRATIDRTGTTTGHMGTSERIGTTGERSWTGAPTRHRRDAIQMIASSKMSAPHGGPAGTTASQEETGTRLTSPDTTTWPDTTSQPDKTWPVTTNLPTKTLPVTTNLPAKTWPVITNLPAKTWPATSLPSNTWPLTTNLPAKTWPVIANLPAKTWPMTSLPSNTWPLTTSLPAKTWPMTTNLPEKTWPSTTSAPIKSWPSPNTWPETTTWPATTSQTEVSTSREPQLSTTQETTSVSTTEIEVRNSTVEVQKVMATTEEPKNEVQTTSDATSTTTANVTQSTTTISEYAEEDVEALGKSMASDEDERIKEDERKEEEIKFKEEEETRRRLFLPSSLRALPDVSSQNTPLEDNYEEPEEMIEPEPELPSRPNRGRRLTRPQTHSFYPYFLNRVLG